MHIRNLAKSSLCPSRFQDVVARKGELYTRFPQCRTIQEKWNLALRKGFWPYLRKHWWSYYYKGKVPETFAVPNYKIGSTVQSQYYKCKVPTTSAVPHFKCGSTFKTQYYSALVMFQQHLQSPTTDLGALSNLNITMVNPTTSEVIKYKIGSDFNSHYHNIKVPATFAVSNYKLGSTSKFCF